MAASGIRPGEGAWRGEPMSGATTIPAHAAADERRKEQEHRQQSAGEDESNPTQEMLPPLRWLLQPDANRFAHPAEIEVGAAADVLRHPLGLRADNVCPALGERRAAGRIRHAGFLPAGFRPLPRTDDHAAAAGHAQEPQVPPVATALSQRAGAPTVPARLRAHPGDLWPERRGSGGPARLDLAGRAGSRTPHCRARVRTERGPGDSSGGRPLAAPHVARSRTRFATLPRLHWARVCATRASPWTSTAPI